MLSNRDQDVHWLSGLHFGLSALATVVFLGAVASIFVWQSRFTTVLSPSSMGHFWRWTAPGDVHQLIGRTRVGHPRLGGGVLPVG